MLHLDDRFIAAARALTFARIHEGTGIPVRTLNNIFACTQTRSAHRKHPARLGDAERIEAICEFMNRELGTSYEVGNVVRTARSHFLGHAGVNLFVGGKAVNLTPSLRDPRFPSPAPIRYPGLTDVWGLVETEWTRSQGRRCNIVLGSALVNGLFQETYLAVSRQFNRESPHTLEFVFAPPDPVSVGHQLLQEYSRAGHSFARIREGRHDTAGVVLERLHLGVDRLYERTWPPAGDPAQAYTDVAVVMADARGNLILAGHGSAGTVAAVHLFEKNHTAIERALSEDRAIIFVSRVKATARPRFRRPDVTAAAPRLANGSTQRAPARACTTVRRRMSASNVLSADRLRRTSAQPWARVMSTSWTPWAEPATGPGTGRVIVPVPSA